jgi:hypothetical protein
MDRERLRAAERPVDQGVALSKFQLGIPLPDCADMSHAPAVCDTTIAWDRMLFSNVQDLRPGKRRFWRREVFEVRTAAGVEQRGEVTFTFNPSFQTLEVHYLTIRRGGEEIDGLVSAERDVVRARMGTELHAYIGDYVGILRLVDLRPGDIVDYSFSWVGVNPVAEPLTMLYLSLDHDPEDMKHTHRVISSPDLAWTLMDDAPPPKAEHFDPDGFRVQDWIFTPTLSAYSPDDGAPPSSQRSRVAVYTPFKSWAEIADWGRSFFDDGPIDEEVNAFAQEALAAAGGDVERAALALVNHVQDNVRDGEVGIGPGGFIPNPAVRVLSRGYGDEKDQAFLLVSLLRALGIEAWPAMTSMSNEDRMHRAPPTPYMFNHYLVNAKWEGVDCWINPMARGQGGRLRERKPMSCNWCLPLRPGSTGLVRMEEPEMLSLRSVKETINLDVEFQSPVTLEIVTTHIGRPAGLMRDRILTTGLENLREQYHEYYKRQFNDAVTSDLVVTEDDRFTNRLVLKETVQWPNLWTMDDDTKFWVFSYRASEVTSLLFDGPTDDRKDPIGVHHPVNYEQDVAISLPPPGGIPWNLPDEEFVVEGAAGRFHRIDTFDGSVYRVKVSFRSIVDRIPADGAPAAAENQREMNSRAYFGVNWIGPIGNQPSQEAKKKGFFKKLFGG